MRGEGSAAPLGKRDAAHARVRSIPGDVVVGGTCLSRPAGGCRAEQELQLGKGQRARRGALGHPQPLWPWGLLHSFAARAE